MSKKFFTSGYKKLIPEINEKTGVICFAGDVRYTLKEILEKSMIRANLAFVYMVNQTIIYVRG
jgi:hypothetical protein